MGSTDTAESFGGAGDGAPEVTVVCITYKHEDYIREALDSFLAQETTFRYQIYVGEDKGPDGTADIIREYAAKYPGVIVPFLRETNMGAQRNLIDMCQRAGTKYIAFCEGDDYWIDEHKLQKQYDHMESHPELSGCFHNTEILSDEDWYLTSFYEPDEEGRRLIPYSIPRYDRSLRAMRMGYYIRFGPAHTSSMFFRWNYDLQVPDWYYTTIFGDHPIMAMQIGRGLLGFLPDVMSVYRRHAGGAIMSRSERQHHLETREDWLVVLEGLAVHFRDNYGNYAAPDIHRRMATEMRNYLTNAVRSEDKTDVVRVIGQHPDAFEFMVNDYTATSRLRNRLMEHLYGSDASALKPAALGSVTAVVPAGILVRRESTARRNRAIDYKRFAGRAKRDGLWLFWCDNKVSYNGGVRSLYEHVIAEHPEINAWWLTRSASLEKMLLSEGLPVCRLMTAQSRSLLSKAEVLFCGSLRGDTFEVRGFNAGLRVVRVLDNLYYENGDHLAPASALETIAVGDDTPSVPGSPRDWRARSNLVVTDSGVLADQLRADGDAESRIVRVQTDPRLLTIREPLTPARKRHVLFSPGSLSYNAAEEVAGWLIDNADAIDDLAQKNGFVLDIHMPAAQRFDARVRDRIVDHENIRFLATFDIHAHLRGFSAAVSGLDPNVYGLMRAQVPVSVCIPNGSSVGERAVGADPLHELIPGPVSHDWWNALTTAVEMMNAPYSPPSNSTRIEEVFGFVQQSDEQTLEKIYREVSDWLREVG